MVEADVLFFGLRLALIYGSCAMLVRLYLSGELRERIWRVLICTGFLVAFVPPTLAGQWLRLGARGADTFLGFLAIVGVSILAFAFVQEDARLAKASVWRVALPYLAALGIGIWLAVIQ